MNKLIKIYVIIIVLLMMATTLSFASTGVVNTNELRLRKEASTSSDIITYLYKGNEVEVLEKSGDWYKIKYQGNEGYVRGDLIDVKEETVETNATAENNANSNTENKSEEIAYPIANITKSVTKIYILPLMTSSIIINVEQGRTITVNKVVNNWAYVTYENKSGWVRNYFLDRITSTTQTTNTEIQQTETKKGYINVDVANIRETASKSAKILTTLVLNSEVKITAEEGDFYKIDINGGVRICC